MDSKSSSKEAWFVKEVEISQPTKGNRFIFPVNAWFGRNKGDGRTKRRFQYTEQPISTPKYKPLVPYEIRIWTADQPNADTDCDIFLKLFGTEGATRTVDLENTHGRFERDGTDIIKVELENIGEPVKMRLGLRALRNKQVRPHWLPDSVEVTNLFSDTTVLFGGNQWLTADRKNDVIVDLPAVTPKGKGGLPATDYTIQVTTSDVRNGGTNANVCCALFGEHDEGLGLSLDMDSGLILATDYTIQVTTSDVRNGGTSANVCCALFGERGDSGELQLKRSATYRRTFQRGHTDEFSFPNMISLGRLRKLRIWHDNSGWSSSWHLDKVVVHDSAADQTYLFPCDQWLSKSEADRQLSRELTCATKDLARRQSSVSVDRDETVYDISVTTGDKREAGTPHHIWIILRGLKMSSKQFWLENSSKKNVFIRGQTDSFEFKSMNLGALEHLVVGHFPREGVHVNARPESERENAWFCQQVSVLDTISGARYRFPCKEWIPLSTKARDALQLQCAETKGQF